ncbi:MAG: hypothetical protein WA892_05120 [Ornithinimicrobium sp.]
MSEPSAKAPDEWSDDRMASTGDEQVDQIVADFVEARSEIDTAPGTEDSWTDERRQDGWDDAEQDRLASLVRAGDEAHRRLQQRLSQDRG